MFPADLLLLSSSNEGGVTHIETASLDGEKNLKPRNAYPQTAKWGDETGLVGLRGSFRGDEPNKSLQ